MWRKWCCTQWGIPRNSTEVKTERVDSSCLMLALPPVANKWAGGSLKGRAVCCCSIQPGCSGNTRGGPGSTPPHEHLCRVREPSCPSPSQALCSGGQWGVSAASPVTPGESLATADMVTAPGAIESTSARRCSSSQEDCGVSEWATGAIDQQRDNSGPRPPSGRNQIIVEKVVEMLVGPGWSCAGHSQEVVQLGNVLTHDQSHTFSI